MRICVLSLHTSPAAQPGQGDAGGMNVYVDQTVRALAAAGHRIDILTADPTGMPPGEHTLAFAEGIGLHHLEIDTCDKDELADGVDELADLLREHEAFTSADLVWAHYWISAEAALEAFAGAESAGAGHPRLVVSMHTIGAVKNRDSDTSHERPQRLDAEERIARSADLLVANTPAERRDLINELGADPAHVVIARPGVDHALFSPGSRSEARAALDIPEDEFLVVCVGRMQFIKGTDVAVDAFVDLRENDPHLAARTNGILLGAASGSSLATGATAYQRELATAIAGEPCLDVRPPVPAAELVIYYRAADVLVMPSRSESFGLVAAEAAATGLPVVAAAVGGLPDIVEHGLTGVLIADHNPHHWAQVLTRLLGDERLRAELGERAIVRAERFDWVATVGTVLGAVDGVGAGAGADPTNSGSHGGDAGGADDSSAVGTRVHIDQMPAKESTQPRKMSQSRKMEEAR